MVVQAYLEGGPVLAKVSSEDGPYLYVQRFDERLELHNATKVEVYHMSDMDALLTCGSCTLMMRVVDADTFAYILKSVGGKVEWA